MGFIRSRKPTSSIKVTLRSAKKTYITYEINLFAVHQDTGGVFSAVLASMLYCCQVSKKKSVVCVSCVK